MDHFFPFNLHVRFLTVISPRSQLDIRGNFQELVRIRINVYIFAIEVINLVKRGQMSCFHDYKLAGLVFGFVFVTWRLAMGRPRAI